MTLRKSLLLGLFATTAYTPLQAQDAIVPPEAEIVEAPADAAPVTDGAQSGPVAAPDGGQPGDENEEGDGEDIVVTGARLRGAVAGDIQPEIQLDRRDIRAYGAGNIAELLEALAPQTRSGRGRGGEQPVVLLNGRRISGFSEIRTIPPEAIDRIDILPEEVALKYGYRADQRVVNFVLRRRFRAVTGELEGGLATAGGRGHEEADVNILRLNRNGRWSLDADYEHESPLFESERDVIETDPDALFDSRPYRTLLPETDKVSLNGTVNRTILGDVSATLNGEFEANSNKSFLGLPDSGGSNPLTRETDMMKGHLGLALGGDIAPWRWSATANYDRSASDSLTETSGPTERARTWTQVGGAEVVAMGSLFDLPAGSISTTFKVGAEARGLRSETWRAGGPQERELSRDRGNMQANVDLPIASRRDDVLGAIGDLSANFNVEIEQLSDFGTLRTLGGGINWEPIDAVDLIVSVTDEGGAPNMQQLGDPTVLTPNVRVFDFLRGETVDINRLDGGNPDLSADNRRVFKVGLTLKPFSEQDLSLTANYVDSNIRNPIASFPTATPEIEAAFPDRFVRDASGRLLSIDNRPVNFARSDRQELRWGINFSKPIGPQRPPGGWRERRGGTGQGGGAAPSTGDRPSDAVRTPPAGGEFVRQGRGGQGGGRGSGGFGGGRGGQGGRLQLSLYHNMRFVDRILIREGVPELDLLNGSAVGSRGGQPRHELEFQAGVSKDGLGARLTGNWESGTTVRGSPLGSTAGDLRFSDFATLNLRLFADLGQQHALVRNHPWLRGTRISLRVDNLLDSHLQVRDANGATPLSYQPDLLDPLGRSVRLSIRKLFF